MRPHPDLKSRLPSRAAVATDLVPWSEPEAIKSSAVAAWVTDCPRFRSASKRSVAHCSCRVRAAGLLPQADAAAGSSGGPVAAPATTPPPAESGGGAAGLNPFAVVVAAGAGALLVSVCGACGACCALRCRRFRRVCVVLPRGCSGLIQLCARSVTLSASWIDVRADLNSRGGTRAPRGERAHINRVRAHHIAING